MQPFLASLVIAAFCANLANWATRPAGALWIFPTRGLRSKLLMAWTVATGVAAALGLCSLISNDLMLWLGPPGAAFLNLHSIEARMNFARNNAARS